MRTRKSLRNVVVTLLLQALTILVTFFTRQYFIRNLGADYLGLNGVFSNVLSILAMSEMGFATAFLVVLFRPIAEKDEARIRALMGYFRRLYNRVGLFIFFAGLAVIPAFPLFVHSPIPGRDVTVYYMLYLAAMSATYFFSYNKTLLVAYQDKYLTAVIAYLVYIFLNALQVTLLILYHNYYLYLTALLLCNLLEGVVVTLVTRKKHPYMKAQARETVDGETKKSISKSVRALFLHGLGGAAVSGTDNIIIAAFVSVVAVGFYSNYNLVLIALSTIIGQAFAALTASVGDLSVTDNQKRMYEVYGIGLYLNALVVITATVILYFVIDDFVALWAGASYVLDRATVVVILVCFLLNGMRRITMSFRDSQGLFWHDRYKPLVEAAVNLVLSVVLAIRFGIVGVFLGTLGSLLVTSFWVEPYILYKHGFHRPFVDYFKRYLLYLALGALAFIPLVFLDEALGPGGTYLVIIGKSALYGTITAAIFVLGTIRSDAFAGLQKIVRGFVASRLQKGQGGVS
ncbi:hypothetical protein IZU99_07135 [Oscillospiraceae bacterium CM]|nr:hypothetical protein IZU99_07135 [Oscillospiraceae bacterium CM]